MGSVFRKTVTKAIPAGAEIDTRKNLARWKQNGKTRTAPLIKAGNRIAVEASTFTAKYRDGSGKIREVATGCKDETAARKKLSELERRAELVKVGLIRPEEDSAAGHLKHPIGQHLAAYLRQLQASPAHRQNVERQLTRIMAGCGFKCLADLDRETLTGWIDQQTQMGNRTRNTYLSAAIAFGNWCSNPQQRRLTSNPFARIAKGDERPVRKRRSLTEPELVKLLVPARCRKSRRSVGASARDKPAPSFPPNRFRSWNVSAANGR